jgi:hypothetical protein
MIPLVTQQLGELNIRVEAVNVPIDQVVARIFSGEFPVLAFMGTSSAPSVDIAGLAPDAPFSDGTTDPELTPLLEEASLVENPAEDPEVFQAINERVLDLGWYSVWAYGDNFFAVDDSVTAEMSAGQQLPLLYTFEPAA